MAHIAQSVNPDWFLGRRFNPLTQCYEFSDNSGPPISLEQAIEASKDHISFLHYIFVIKPELEEKWYDATKR